MSSAQAVVAPHLAATSGARFAPAPVDFAEDRDPQGRSGAHTAIFQPATQGFRGYSGPLRVGFAIKAGSVLIDGRDAPNTFTGIGADQAATWAFDGSRECGVGMCQHGFHQCFTHASGHAGDGNAGGWVCGCVHGVPRAKKMA